MARTKSQKLRRSKERQAHAIQKRLDNKAEAVKEWHAANQYSKQDWQTIINAQASVNAQRQTSHKKNVKIVFDSDDKLHKLTRHNPIPLERVRTTSRHERAIIKAVKVYKKHKRASLELGLSHSEFKALFIENFKIESKLLKLLKV